MMIKPLILGLAFSVLAGCSSEDDQAQHPSTSSFEEATSPKKIQSKPCSRYNLKFYGGDVREFTAQSIDLGDAVSDAVIEINDRKIKITGFEGQAEEYINYSMYRGMKYKETKDGTGAMTSTKTETQIIVCFRKDAIAVKQLIENVRARGELSKASYLTKQWLWELDKS
ncbi:MAG: hypothetical protein ACI8WB_002371 [Phenylobacterium sp.]|jgi:hypothetical protein